MGQGKRQDNVRDGARYSTGHGMVLGKGQDKVGIGWSKGYDEVRYGTR